MTISEFTLKSRNLASVRRFEAFTGSGRRRKWSLAEKARIVATRATKRFVLLRADMLCPHSNCSPGVGPAAETTASESLFVPAVVAAPMPEPAAKRPPRPRKQKAARDIGVIELVVDDVAMRVGRGADAKTVAAVIRAR